MNAVTENPMGYDPFSAEVMADPLPFYAHLRREAPVLFLEKYDSLVFSRFQDIVDVMTTPANAFVASESTLPTMDTLLRRNDGVVRAVPMDPIPPGPLLGSPHFEVLRTAHMRPFRPTQVRAMATFIQLVCDERLDALLTKRQFDLTQDYGGYVAASTICHMFDMPLGRAGDVLELVNDLSRTDKEGGANDVPTIIGTCVAMMIDRAPARGWRRRGEPADRRVDTTGLLWAAAERCRSGDPARLCLCGRHRNRAQDCGSRTDGTDPPERWLTCARGSPAAS